MNYSLKPSLAFSKITIIDAVRRASVIGLFSLGLLLIASLFFFFNFIPRDIGQFSIDFIVSVVTLIGMLFLLFHCVQTVSWDSEKGIIQSIMARPLSRFDYVLGLFFGLGLGLLLLNTLLGIFGYVALKCMQLISQGYFDYLSLNYYLLTLLGVMSCQLMILAVVIFFSSIMRGAVPVLILSLGYYFTCNGLPVVRESMRSVENTNQSLVEFVLIFLTMVFPDLSRFDYKGSISSVVATVDQSAMFINLFFTVCYVLVFLTLAGTIYQKRDLQ